MPSFFLFINNFKEKYIRKLDKKIAIIYRNYEKGLDKKLILKIKKVCKKDGRKFYLSNNIKIAINLDLDGVYLPSFNKNLNFNKNNLRTKFIIIGSAHSVKQIKVKENQGVKMIFLSPIFKTKKSNFFLNTIKFNILAAKSKKKVIALGGITSKNLKKLKLTKAFGFAGISYFKNNNKIINWNERS